MGEEENGRHGGETDHHPPSAGSDCDEGGEVHFTFFLDIYTCCKLLPVSGYSHPPGYAVSVAISYMMTYMIIRFALKNDQIPPPPLCQGLGFVRVRWSRETCLLQLYVLLCS